MESQVELAETDLLRGLVSSSGVAGSPSFFLDLRRLIVEGFVFSSRVTETDPLRRLVFPLCTRTARVPAESFVFSTESLSRLVFES